MISVCRIYTPVPHHLIRTSSSQAPASVIAILRYSEGDIPVIFLKVSMKLE